MIIRVQFLPAELESCKMYGLITGGPQANIERCEEILRLGRERGFTPGSTEKLIKKFMRWGPGLIP